MSHRLLLLALPSHKIKYPRPRGLMAFAIATATACMVNCYKLNYLLTHLL